MEDVSLELIRKSDKLGLIYLLPPYTYQLVEMRLLLPGSHPGLVSGVNIGLGAGLARVHLAPAAGLGGGRGVVTCGITPHHHSAPRPRPLLERGEGAVLSILQLLQLLLLLALLLGLPVRDEPHGSD